MIFDRNDKKEVIALLGAGSMGTAIVRNWVPQLSRSNIAGNQPIVELLRDFAEQKGATPAQISFA